MAPGLFPNPSSHDGADKLNHKWMLLLMLLLALITFIIPLHPMYNTGQISLSSSPPIPLPTLDSMSIKPVKIPKFKVSCWCPKYFTGAHVLYATAYCTNAYNSALRGEGNKNVYRVFDSPIPINVERRDAIQEIPTVKKQYIEMDQRHSPNDFTERVKKLVSFQAPITLLLVAVGLGLSHIVWAFFVECGGSFNLGKTLDAAACQKTSVDGSAQQQAFENIAESLSTTIGSSPRTLSHLHIFKKIMSVIFVLAFLLVLCQYSLPQVEELQEELDSFSVVPSPTSQDEETVSNAKVNGTDRDKGSDQSDGVKTNDGFICEMEIRQLQNIQTFALQCVPVEDEDEDRNSGEGELNPAQAPSASLSSSAVKNLLEFESLMFKIAIAVLVVLLVSNIFSLIAWTYKLMAVSTRTSIGLRSNTPADVVLLVQMARVNASADVAYALAKSFNGVKV